MGVFSFITLSVLSIGGTSTMTTDHEHKTPIVIYQPTHMRAIHGPIIIESILNQFDQCSNYWARGTHRPHKVHSMVHSQSMASSGELKLECLLLLSRAHDGLLHLYTNTPANTQSNYINDIRYCCHGNQTIHVAIGHSHSDK